MKLFRLLIAMAVDLLDILVFLPTTDIGEAPAMFLVANMLGLDSLQQLLALTDGALPPPFDIVPVLTLSVIYEDYIKKD